MKSLHTMVQSHRPRRHRAQVPLEQPTSATGSDITMIPTGLDQRIVSDTARVYISYNIRDPPPHPGVGWTRFVCISDTHSRRYEVPAGDVLLHSGDLSSWGHFSQLRRTMDWIKTLPHPVKILIAGNHDLCLDEDWGPNGMFATEGECISNADMTAAEDLMRCQTTRDRGIHYLEHEPLQITTNNGRIWQVYGSPAAPRYALGAFQYDGSVASTDGDEIYAQIPASTEILLTHTPPHGICDTTKRHKHAGCHTLKDRLDSPGMSGCRLHVFGHIHEAQGAAVNPIESEKGKVRVSVNAAMHDYNPIIVDLLN